MSAGGGGGSGGGRPAATANWLILGGCGFLGRNFVKYLLDNGLAASVRVADKRHPLMCALSADHKAALLNRDLVELLQVDLAEDEGIDRAFAPPRGGGGWDFVVNLAAETAHGKPAEFYERGVACAGKAAAAAVAAAAAGAPVKRFIQVSSAFVYKPESSGSAEGAGEGARVEPWTEPARACARAEDAARTAAGLPLVVLRPATVYGPGDVAGLMPRCVVAATYKADGAKMEMLWDGTLKVSTVHVFDVVRAIYFAAKKAPVGSGA
jgi:nucleoside-diphosphate-sugar epimerase